MNSYASQSRTIVCALCKQRRRIKATASELCPRCEKAQSAELASVTAEYETGNQQWPKYIHVRSYEQGVCSGCSSFGPIYEPDAQLCKTCHQKKLTRLSKDVLKVKIKCAVCHKLRRSVCLSEDICLPCYLARQNGVAVCIGCGKEKVIWVMKGGARCRYCYKDHAAPRSLKKFVDEYQGFNRKYLTDLLEPIKTAIDEKTNRRFRGFGKFLQQVTLADPLTWESVDEVMPAFVSKKQTNIKNIRSCLLDLAYLHVSQGKLEKREDYLARRIVQNLVTQAPKHFQDQLRDYVDRRTTLKHAPSTMRYDLVSINPFLRWCDARQVKCISEVNEYMFEEYEQFLRWEWVCSSCNETVPYDVYGDTPMCRVCGIGVIKTRRYAYETVKKDCNNIRAFFIWNERNGRGRNPVTVPSRDALTFRYYSDDTIQELATYAFLPDTKPLEGIVLYLTIFHAFSVWELTHALLPNGENAEPQALADAYSVLLPRREGSRGNHSPGRPEARVEFPTSIAELLKLLLQRYEEWRLETVKNPSNRFLLVAPGQARHDNAVSREFVRRVVKRGSKRAGVGECNPKRLRATSGVIHADSGVIGVLVWLGWSRSHGFKYTWNDRRELVRPRNMPAPPAE